MQEAQSKTKPNRLMGLILIGVGIGLLVYVGFYIVNLLNPEFEEVPTTRSTVELKETDIQIIQDLNKINTYLLQPTVNPNEIGRPNPFAPV